MGHNTGQQSTNATRGHPPLKKAGLPPSFVFPTPLQLADLCAHLYPPGKRQTYYLPALGVSL